MYGTIVEDGNGQIHIRFSDDEPLSGGKITVIDTLQSRNDEPDEEFTERCERYVEEVVKKDKK
ncbi:MAG: hypothetical protein U9Q03_01160 [Patescibacteria group bacterium]|nr:hypothetical protein [Patescibacteria group bacterium]